MNTDLLQSPRPSVEPGPVVHDLLHDHVSQATFVIVGVVVALGYSVLLPFAFTQRVSWHNWHRRYELMPWPFFQRLFYRNPQDDNDPNNGRTAFVVRFSSDVYIDTIRYDSVQMRVVTIDQPTDWRLIRRIPIVRFDYTPHTGGSMPGTTDQIRIIVSPDWIGDEIQGKSSWLSGDGFEVEFELDGFGILDCHRQPIDAEAIGLEAFPTGNGSLGGFYRSAFRVHAKPHRPGYAA